MNYYGFLIVLVWIHQLCGITLVYVKEKETGYVFEKPMNNELVEKFNNQTFTQGSVILKIKYYNPKKLIVQQLPVKEEE